MSIATRVRTIDQTLLQLVEQVKELRDTKIDTIISLPSKVKGCFECSITSEVMVYPVTLKCGHTFERNAIKKWLMKSCNCPLCQKMCYFHEVDILENNFTLINIIDEFYGEYRSLKILSQNYETINEWDTFLSHPSIVFSSFVLNADLIKEIGTIIDGKIHTMLKNGCNVIEPMSNEWDTWTSVIETNHTVKRAISDKLKLMGLCYEQKKIEYQDSIQTGKKRKLVTKYRYETKISFIDKF